MTSAENTKSIAGVDGCKHGWVVVSRESDVFAVKVVPQFAMVLEDPHHLVVVDIPIGLLEKGTRHADSAARQLLKRRSCCVFTAPTRPILACASYSGAKACRLRIDGKSLSKQAWAIMPKIAEVDNLIDCQLQNRVREGHPEVSFAQMNRGEPLRLSKHSVEGRHARISLLSRHFPDVSSVIQKHNRITEDVIDAFAMLWTAERIRSGQALAMPSDGQTDSRGLVVQIWA